MFWLVITIAIVGYYIVNELYKQTQLKKFELQQRLEQQQLPIKKFELQQRLEQQQLPMKIIQEEKFINSIIDLNKELMEAQVESQVAYREELKDILKDKSIKDKDKFNSALAVKKKYQTSQTERTTAFVKEMAIFEKEISTQEGLEKLRIREEKVGKEWDKKLYLPHEEWLLLQPPYDVLAEKYADKDEYGKHKDEIYIY